MNFEEMKAGIHRAGLNLDERVCVYLHSTQSEKWTNDWRSR